MIVIRCVVYRASERACERQSCSTRLPAEGRDRYGYMQEGRGGPGWWSGTVLGEMQYGIRRSMHADDEERACVRACIG